MTLVESMFLVSGDTMSDVCGIYHKYISSDIIS